MNPKTRFGRVFVYLYSIQPRRVSSRTLILLPRSQTRSLGSFVLTPSFRPFRLCPTHRLQRGTGNLGVLGPLRSLIGGLPPLSEPGFTGGGSTSNGVPRGVSSTSSKTPLMSLTTPDLHPSRPPRPVLSPPPVHDRRVSVGSDTVFPIRGGLRRREPRSVTCLRSRLSCWVPLGKTQDLRGSRVRGDWSHPHYGRSLTKGTLISEFRTPNTRCEFLVGF